MEPRITKRQRWSQEDSEMARLMQRAGSTLESIAAVVERSVDQVERHLNDLANCSGKSKPLAMRRECLCCRKPFTSEGPHNRMCNACRKAAAANTSPFNP